MKVTAISGYGEKGPACFLVETEGKRFVLDLGEGPQPGHFPDVSGMGPVDTILISHGHADHIGGLHLATALGSPPIYATPMVRALKGHPALAGVVDLPLSGEIAIAGIPVRTGRAGHAAGGVWLRIGGEAGVLYSGDYSRESVLYPHDAPAKARLLIADASYGVFDEALTVGIEALADIAARGPVLLPCPPTGRGLEIAVLMHERGLAVGLCDQHRQTAETILDGAPDVLVPDGAGRLRSMLAGAAGLNADSRPYGIMIAANGAATAGLAEMLLSRFATDPSVAMVFTGHVEAGTRGHALIESGQASFIRWNVHPRLSDLQWLIDRVSPESTLPAFLPEAQVAKLGEALRDTRLKGPSI